MRRRLPPLNALRAYEAAARHLSFTKAAEELFVSQAAISHQVKALEDHLGTRLFRRLNRALLLTEAGQAYLPPVSQALELIHEATARVVRGEDRGPLTVSALPSFAARWLVPRLGRFLVAHPEIDVHIAPSHTLVDFTRDEVDVAIRYGRGNYPGLRADRLLDEEIFPVCSPGLAQGRHALRKPVDLRHHTLLHDDGPDDWQAWLNAAGVSGVDATRGPVFTDASMVIQAAVAGQGVALARGALASGDLAAGTLVRPFRLSLPAENAYWVVCPPAAAMRPKIAAFREWLLREAAAEPAARACAVPLPREARVNH